MGRFVTRRRRTVTKLKNSKVSFNFSDDFASGDFGSSRVPKPSRRKVPPAPAPSSAENAEILSVISNFPANTLKEIPHELSDHTRGSCPRKPIFCSTPSAGHFPNRPCLKSIAIGRTTEQWGSPMCGSGDNVLIPFQHHLESPGRPGLHSGKRLRLSFGDLEASGDLFRKTKISDMTKSCGEGGKEYSFVTENKMGEASLSGNLFSSESLESTSQVLSATGDREWLIDALKEKCLHVPCTVQLERLNNPTVSHLCSQTYSSFLQHSLDLRLSASRDETKDSVLSVDTQSISSSSSKKRNGQSISVQCVKTSRNATGDKKGSTSTDRTGITRKACVSGLSVNRWKNKDSSGHTFKNPTADGRKNSAVVCNLSEMIAAKSRKQSQMKVRHTHLIGVDRLNY